MDLVALHGAADLDSGRRAGPRSHGSGAGAWAAGDELLHVPVAQIKLLKIHDYSQSQFKFNLNFEHNHRGPATCTTTTQSHAVPVHVRCTVHVSDTVVSARDVSATPPSKAIEALVLGGPEVIRVVLSSSRKYGG